jgi:hypothetical protein
VRINEADGTWRMLDGVMSTHIDHIFALVTRAGASIALQSQRRLTRRPYAEKFNGFGGSQQSLFKSEISDGRNGNGKNECKDRGL